MKQVLIRRPALHGNMNRMERGEIISSKGDMVTVKSGRKTFEVKSSDTMPLDGPKGSRIVSMPSPARATLTKL